MVVLCKPLSLKITSPAFKTDSPIFVCQIRSDSGSQRTAAGSDDVKDQIYDQLSYLNKEEYLLLLS